MNVLKNVVVVASIVLATPVAIAQVSGGIDVKSSYVLDDAIVATDGPVIQGYASVELGNGFSANLWGSKGLDTDVGDELDIGVSWNHELENGLGVKAVVNRFFFRDFPEMNEFTVGVSYGSFDTSVTQYVWEGGFEDGSRVQVGYNFAPVEKWSARLEVTAETGIQLPDAVIFGADVGYQLTENVSIFATGYLPTRNDGFREQRLLFGLGYSF